MYNAKLVLTVTLNQPKFLSDTICSGETYTWAADATAYTVSGTYTKLNDGCTANQELVLTVTLNQPKFLLSDHLFW
jgi:hypothetical protein